MDQGRKPTSQDLTDKQSQSTPVSEISEAHLHIKSLARERDMLLIQMVSAGNTALMKEYLKDLVSDEGFEWKKDIHNPYFSGVENRTEDDWTNIITPTIKSLNIEPEVALDLASGRGRNTVRLLDTFKQVIAVDIIERNIQECRLRFQNDNRVRVIKNNGFDLSEITDNSISFVFCFDSMVHFSPIIIALYLMEFYRVLKPGGSAFCHHSNCSTRPGGDYRRNIHWRNYMSASLFLELCKAAGLTVISQQVIDWGGARNLDCLSLFKK
jgi:SAM-dependent methyltransferase